MARTRHTPEQIINKLRATEVHINSGLTRDGRSFRMLAIIDEYTRECLSIDVARKLNHDDVLERLSWLMGTRGVPNHIRSDNGSEFTAKAVCDWLKQVEVKTLYIEPGRAWENGCAESCGVRCLRQRYSMSGNQSG